MPFPTLTKNCASSTETIPEQSAATIHLQCAWHSGHTSTSPTAFAIAGALLRRRVGHEVVEFFARAEQFLHRRSEPREF